MSSRSGLWSTQSRNFSFYVSYESYVKGPRLHVIYTLHPLCSLLLPKNVKLKYSSYIFSLYSLFRDSCTGATFCWQKEFTQFTVYCVVDHEERTHEGVLAGDTKRQRVTVIDLRTEEVMHHYDVLVRGTHLSKYQGIVSRHSDTHPTYDTHKFIDSYFVRLDTFSTSQTIRDDDSSQLV